MAARTLKDEKADMQVRESGYVVIDLLATDEVERLRDAWGDLATVHPPIWDPTGMAATVRHPGLDWDAHQRIMSVVAGPLEQVTDTRVCFMSTYVAKRPDSSVLPAHLDFRLVDEPDELTQGCWIALQDMDEVVGALGVVPGSHHHVDFDRTPEEPGHEWAMEQIEQGAETEILHIHAGQAVIFDHRLVHFSERNRSGEVRLAAVLGLSRPQVAEAARERLLTMMYRGMEALGSSPQIPDMDEQKSMNSTVEDQDLRG